MKNENKKTFVEWCREYRTPKRDYDFWYPTYPTYLSGSRRSIDQIKFDIKLKEMQNKLDRWKEREQRKLMDSMILPPQRY